MITPASDALSWRSHPQSSREQRTRTMRRLSSCIYLFVLTCAATFATAASAAAANLPVITWNLDIGMQTYTYAHGQMAFIAGLSPVPQVVVLQEASPDVWNGTCGDCNGQNGYLKGMADATGLTWTGLQGPTCASVSGNTCTSWSSAGSVVIMTSLPTTGSAIKVSLHCDYYVAGRTAVHLGVVFEGTTVNVFGVHLQADDPSSPYPSYCAGMGGETSPSRNTERATSVSELISWMSTFPGPKLVGGDFNAAPNESPISDTSAGMTTAFTDAWAAVGSGNGYTFHLTFPNCGNSLFKRIDYWFSDAGGSATPQSVSNPGLATCYGGYQSDHIPLVTQYAISSLGPWTSQDVGAVGTTGSATVASGTWTVKGAGADIWGSTDAFHFVYQPLSGDTTVIAQVSNMTNTSTFAKAGVMMRNSLAANDVMVVLDVRPGGAVEFMDRSATGGSVSFIATTTVSFPNWLKLVRTGTTITGYASNDGTTWTTVGTITLSALSTTVDSGFIVCSHDTLTLNTSTFQSLSTSGWTSQDIGNVGLAGSASNSSGTWTVTGAGADVWGTADGLHFVSQSLSGNSTVIAEVHDMGSSSSFAKAGIMLRNSASAGDPMVILDVRPGGAIEFMQRTSAGGSVSFLNTATVSFPVWLKLVRSGTTISASVSSDGSTYSPVGSATNGGLNTSVDSGFLSVSHDTLTLNPATVQAVSMTTP